uniref:Uncharacterized protein n=1 Tax=Lepeophtheirus salmonis TaxID=72036 RepID=A0A0K2U268_LEPSM
MYLLNKKLVKKAIKIGNKVDFKNDKKSFV